MNVWGITDRGVIREQNQDAFAHQVLPDGRVLALVCDRMGGARRATSPVRWRWTLLWTSSWRGGRSRTPGG